KYLILSAKYILSQALGAPTSKILLGEFLQKYASWGASID
ncbi:hypothetical protein SS7213T_08072, partial [Staphylococcus simiae CCM 7213 = CCUG 51256]